MSADAPRPTLGRLLAGWVTRPSFWAVLTVMLLGSAYGAFRLAGARVTTLRVQSADQRLGALGEVPAFALTRHDTSAFGRDALLGKVWIANFIFTRCPTVCPKFTAKMAQVQRRTELLGTDLQLVSFSVDPKHDTPERLAAYGEKYGADFSRWSFLTGKHEALEKTVVEGFKISMGRDPEVADEVFSIFHGEHFVLVDRAGKIRGYYQSSDQEAVDRLVSDAMDLAASSPPSVSTVGAP